MNQPLLGNKPTKLADNREAAAIVVIYCNFMIFILYVKMLKLKIQSLLSKALNIKKT